MKKVLEDLRPDEGLQNIQREIDSAEQRFERAKFLFLSGDIGKEKFQSEKIRRDELVNRLQNDNYNTIMALYNLLRRSLDDWDRTLPTKRKRLLRLVTEAVFLRGSSIFCFSAYSGFSPLPAWAEGILYLRERRDSNPRSRP